MPFSTSGHRFVTVTSPTVSFMTHQMTSKISKYFVENWMDVDKRVAQQKMQIQLSDITSIYVCLDKRVCE